MYKRSKKIFALCLTVVMLSATVALQNVTYAATPLGGTDRYQTALKIVQAGWTKSDSAIIARGDDLADALAAAPLAYAKGKAPILLTKPGELPTGVLAELKSLGVKNIYIVGGTGAVSIAVQNSLKDFTIKRITGKDRIETSYKVALEAFPTAPTEVVIANGLAYADALSISSIAAVKGMPILLVSNNTLTTEQTSYIAGKTVYAVGGTGVIGASVVTQAKATRLAGADRYETNAAILAKFPQNYSKIYLAKGTNENLVDALTGSALAALGNYPIVLVNSKSAINAKISVVVKANISIDSAQVLLGGTVAQVAATSVEAMKPLPFQVISIE
jgi:putative cell wall-binding protein